MRRERSCEKAEGEGAERAERAEGVEARVRTRAVSLMCAHDSHQLRSHPQSEGGSDATYGNDR